MFPLIFIGCWIWVIGSIVTFTYQAHESSYINWSHVLLWPFWAILEIIKHTWHALKDFVRNFND